MVAKRFYQSNALLTFVDGLGLLLGAVAFSLLGSSIGIITGLTPGLHVNLVAQILLSVSLPLAAILTGVFPPETSLLFLACAIVACSVTHTFLDIIPSVFLGAPDPDSVLSVLPGHRMMLDGLGLDAVRLSLLASLSACVICMAVIPLARFIVGPPLSFYERIIPFIPLILFIILTLLVLMEKPKDGMPFWSYVSNKKYVVHPSWKGKVVPVNFPIFDDVDGTNNVMVTGIMVKANSGCVCVKTPGGNIVMEGTLEKGVMTGDCVKALCVVKRVPGISAHVLSRFTAVIVLLTAGFLGLLILGTGGLTSMAKPLWENLPSSGLLMPLLTGLFGTSGLIISLRTTGALPVQENIEIGLGPKPFFSSVTTGTLAGSLVGWLPGVTSSQATIISSFGQRNGGKSRFDKDRAFIAAVSAVNTANAFFVLLALFTIGKARSGAMGVASSLLPQITMWNHIMPPRLIIILTICALIASLVGFFSGRWLCKPLVTILSKLNYKITVGAVIIILTGAVLAFAGPVGILVLIPSTALGMMPPFLGVKRVHL
ncbi:MAG TPA: hypothetical protein ENN76_01310, partial [Euryarchaeota archaeon]|nr:hypothetical protein [Euryarchaeota archaeon]